MCGWAAGANNRSQLSQSGLRLAPECGLQPEVAQLELEIADIRRVSKTGLQIDLAATDQFFDLRVEVLHAFPLTIAHGVQQALAFFFSFLHVLAGARGGLEDLDKGNAGGSVC